MDIEIKQSYLYWELLAIWKVLRRLKSKGLLPDGMDQLAIEDCKKRLRLSESIEEMMDCNYLEYIETRYGSSMKTSPLPAFQAMAKAAANVNPQYQCFSSIIAKSHQDITSSNALQGWLRSRNTLEVLWLWEQEHNHEFKFDVARKFIIESEFNNAGITIKRWITETNATGIVALQGRYGGTYAHPIIALDFEIWLSPERRLALCSHYLIKNKINGFVIPR